MKKNKCLDKGFVHYAKGWRKVEVDLREQLGDKFKGTYQWRYFAAMNRFLAEAVGPIEKLTHLDVFAADSKLRASLTKEGYARGYVRSILCYFHKVIADAPAVEIHSEQVVAFNRILSQFGPEGLAKIKNATTATKYFKQFVQRTKVDLSTRDGNVILAAFEAFLCKECGFFELGASLRAYKRAIKYILRQAGFSFSGPKKAPVFSAAIEAWIASLKNHALGVQHADQADHAPKRKLSELVKEKRKAARRIKPATWKKTERNLRVYLDWWRERPNVALETAQDALVFFHLDRFEEFTDDAHDKNRYTGATVETIVDSLGRVLKLSARCTPSLITEAEAEERKSRLWKYNFEIKRHFTKPGVNLRLQEKGGAPKHELLLKGLIHSLDEILPDVARDHVLADHLEKDGDVAQVEKIRYNLAVRVFDLTAMTFWHTFANRPEDLHHRILASHLVRYASKDGEVFVLGYLPSKTEGNPRPSEVEGTLPPWFFELIDYYLKNCRDRLYPGTKYLFPAQKAMKEKHSQFAHANETRQGNLPEWAQRKSHKYFGIALSANEMRKSLTNFFEEEDLKGLHRFTGHLTGLEKKEYEERFTQVERDHYIVNSFTHDVVRKDTRLYRDIAEIYKERGIDVAEIPKLADLIEIERKKLVVRLAKKKSAA